MQRTGTYWYMLPEASQARKAIWDALDGKATRRRRECLKCGKRFTTYEKVGSIELKVVKKDGRVEDYRREKLERCFEKACWKLTSEERSKIIDEIEMKLLHWESVEILNEAITKKW